MGLVAAPALAEEAPDLTACQRRLEDILARPEFRAVPRELGGLPEITPPSVSFPAWLKDVMKKAVSAIEDWLERLFSSGSREREPDSWIPHVAPAAAWSMGIGGGVLLAFLLWMVIRRRPAAAQGSPDGVRLGGEGMPDALSRPADSWERLAEQFVREGQWRLALRALYLALLVTLHQRGIIRYERERTNGDYVGALSGNPVREPFASLTVLFDQAWYGNKPFDALSYQAAQGWARAVEEAAAPLGVTS
jgi:hypothetical protein